MSESENRPSGFLSNLSERSDDIVIGAWILTVLFAVGGVLWGGFGGGEGFSITSEDFGRIVLFALAPQFLVLPIQYIGSQNRISKLEDCVSELDETIGAKTEKKNSEIKRLDEDLKYYIGKLERVAFSEIDARVRFDIRISNFNNFVTYAPLFVARRLGFFWQERLDVVIENRGNDDSAIEALLADRCQVAVTDPIAALRAEARLGRTGSDAEELVILAPFLNKAALWVVSTRAACDFQNRTGLSGLTFSTDTTAYALANAWLNEGGAGADARLSPFGGVAEGGPDVGSTGVNMADFMSDMLLSEEVDKYDYLVLSEPEATWLLNKENPFDTITPFHELFLGEKEYAFTSIICKRKLLDRNPEVPFRFLKAVQSAITHIYSLPAILTYRNVGEYQASITNVQSLFARSAEWRRVVEAIMTDSFECYPAMGVQEEDVVRIMEWMRFKQYFPRNILHSGADGTSRGLTEAYRFAAHSDAIISPKGLHDKVLDLTSWFLPKSGG